MLEIKSRHLTWGGPKTYLILEFNLLSFFMFLLAQFWSYLENICQTLGFGCSDYLLIDPSLLMLFTIYRDIACFSSRGILLHIYIHIPLQKCPHFFLCRKYGIGYPLNIGYVVKYVIYVFAVSIIRHWTTWHT